VPIIETALPQAGQVPERPRRRYTSPAMRERRRRIVEMAHRLLGEGVGALTIRRLSEEAHVAQRTIYRLFGDKEGVISATVVDRMIEVREAIAARGLIYTLPVVFDELDWMVSEMERDTLYARVVVGFVFEAETRALAVRELTSVARNRFLGWHAVQERAGAVRGDLDIQQVVRDHVMHEFLVYRRWTLQISTSEQCRLELRASFLRSASLLLKDPAREEYLTGLARIQARLAQIEQGLQDPADGESDDD